MPIDPFFTSTAPRRSATAWAEEKADPDLLKLKGGERSRKITELKRRLDARERLSEGEWWFLRSARATFKTQQRVGRRKVALNLKIRHDLHKPVIFGGLNTK